MELKEKITLDMLTKDSVSVLRQQFLTFNGEEMQVGGNIRNAYMNDESGREQIRKVLSDDTTMLLWQSGEQNRQSKSRQKARKQYENQLETEINKQEILGSGNRFCYSTPYGIWSNRNRNCTGYINYYVRRYDDCIYHRRRHG